MVLNILLRPHFVLIELLIVVFLAGLNIVIINALRLADELSLLTFVACCLSIIIAALLLLILSNMSLSLSPSLW